jgi:flagellar protein FliJ
MPIFRFTLNPVLRIRSHAEDQRKRELGEAMREQDAAERAVEALQNEQNEALAIADAQNSAFDPQNRRQLVAYLHYLGERIQLAQATVQEKINQVALATEALRKAMQERKILERLKEIRLKEHQVLVSRHEQKALDEHAAHFLRRENQARSNGGDSRET